MIMNIVEIKDKKYNNASDNKNIKFKKYKNYNTIFLFFFILYYYITNTTTKNIFM